MKNVVSKLLNKYVSKMFVHNSLCGMLPFTIVCHKSKRNFPLFPLIISISWIFFKGPSINVVVSRGREGAGYLKEKVSYNIKPILKYKRWQGVGRKGFKYSNFETTRFIESLNLELLSNCNSIILIRNSRSLRVNSLCFCDVK